MTMHFKEKIMFQDDTEIDKILVKCVNTDILNQFCFDLLNKRKI